MVPFSFHLLIEKRENNPKMKAMLKFKFWPRFSVVLKLQRPALPVTKYANCSANCVFSKEEREEKIGLKNVFRIQI